MKKLPSTAAAIWLAVSVHFGHGSLDAQANPDSLPPMEHVVEAFVRGDLTRRLPTHLIWVCPNVNPYGDRLMLRLMAAEQTPQLVGRTAAMWRMAIHECGDERYSAWFRARLTEAEHWNQARPLVEGLLQHRTPQNIAAVKAFAFDTTRAGEVRAAVLYELHYGRSERDKVELFMEAYRHPGEMPESYASTTQQNLIAGSAARLFAERLIETVFQYPDKPDAAYRLLNLVSDVHWGMGRDQPGLRGIAIQALQRAAQNADGRVPPRFVAVARQRLSELREQRVIP